MALKTLADIRQSWGQDWADASDEEVLGAYAKAIGAPASQVADVLGFDPGRGSMSRERLSSSIDNYQANLYGLVGAGARAVGADGLATWADQRRGANEVRADVAAGRAQALGAVDDWRNIDGLGDAGNYVGGLAIQSLPYLAEAAAGGLVTRGLMSGTRAALAGAKTVEAANAARRALNIGSMAGAAAASYPSAAADILSNQRSENGQENLGAALAGGVPYAALNALGLEGLAARGLRPLVAGEGGVARRMATAGATTALGEGTGETGQEVVNQYFGRMAVNPEQTLFNPEANKRYVDSFVGGAALGGMAGSVGGLRRRESPAATVDLLNPATTPEQATPLQIGFSGYDTGVGELVSMPDGSVMTRADYNQMYRTGQRPDGSLDFIPPLASELSSGRTPYDYTGGIDFSTDMPTSVSADISAPGLQIPEGVPGAQPDMFDPLREALPEQGAQAPEADTATPRDPYTRDMLAETPTAMARTMFNPEQEPTTGAGPGAIASEIRSQLTQQLGQATGYTTKLAYDLSRVLTDVPATMEMLATEQAKLDKEMQKLDRKVSGDSNMLTPEEYEAKRTTLEDKMLALEAAKALAQRYNKALTQAYADEARAKAPQPDPNKQPAPPAPEPSPTEQQMRENSMAAAVEDTDRRVAGGNAARSAQAREDILGRVLADPATREPQARFEAELRREGYTDAAATAGELEKIARFMTAKAAFPTSGKGSRSPQSREAMSAELVELDDQIDRFENLLACLGG